MTAVETTATPFMSQAHAVGQGFDVYGTLDARGLITPLAQIEGTATKTFTFLGVDYLIPAWMVGIEDMTDDCIDASICRSR